MRASAREALGWVFTPRYGASSFLLLSQAFSKMPNSISREEYVKPGLLKTYKLWVMLLAIAVISLTSMCFLALNDR